MKATHNGTCQVCGRMQAVKAKGLAKHGYTVEWGFFSGVCDGAGEAPVEESTEILDATVSRLSAAAARLENTEPSQIGEVDIEVENPDYNAWGRGRARQTYIRVSMDREQFEAHKAQEIEAGHGFSRGWHGRTWEEEQEWQHARMRQWAREMREHCATLERLKASRHGQPLEPRS